MITREPEFLPPPSNVFAATGRAIVGACRSTGRALVMLLGAAVQLPYMFSKRNRADVFQQLYQVGIKSLGVVSVVALFTGMILALQVGIELRRYGQENNIGMLVCISMLREMGPFMTGLVIAASVGSAIAAQMGTMTVSEEIAALDVMGISPLRYLMMGGEKMLPSQKTPVTIINGYGPTEFTVCSSYHIVDQDKWAGHLVVLQFPLGGVHPSRDE